MCGIAGFELRGNDRQLAARLLQRLARRGPDGGWYAEGAPYGFVQTRLSVIDLSERVRYPLRSESGDLFLLYNGEIYGYESERAVLQRRGHRFATECDAEVLLHGYEEWGIDVFARLDGMFAAALFHAPSRELVLARDALGIKPLVHTTAGRFGFCSDAISLVAAGLSDGTVDEAALGEYLAFHYLPPPSTGVTDVVQLAPGTMLRRAADGTSTTERWRRKPFTHASGNAPVGIAEAQDALDSSVRRQLVADVPVGVFLSSGIDSSLVLDSAVRSGARPTAFTIGFPGHGDYDESGSAGRLARALGVPHVVSELSVGFADAVQSVAEAYDQPFADASAIATVHLARLARQQVTVALSGTGGDDLFAGYYRHRAHLLIPLLSRLPVALVRRLASIPRRHGGERRSAAAVGRAYLARLAGTYGKDAFSQYLELAGSASSDYAKRLLGDAATPAEVSRQAVARRFSAPTTGGGSILRSIQAFELETYLAGDLLPKEDRATMAVGLEGRVPLLGAELVDLAERAPDNQKAGLLGGKRLLREIARRRLPTYVTRARKRGFAVPLDDFFAGPWRADAIEWFATGSSSIVDCGAASEMLRGRQMPTTDAWALAALVGWESVVKAAALSAIR